MSIIAAISINIKRASTTPQKNSEWYFLSLFSAISLVPLYPKPYSTTINNTCIVINEKLRSPKFDTPMTLTR